MTETYNLNIIMNFFDFGEAVLRKIRRTKKDYTKSWDCSR